MSGDHTEPLSSSSASVISLLRSGNAQTTYQTGVKTIWMTSGFDAELFEEEEEFCLQMQGLQGLQNPLQNGIHGLFQNAKLL